MNTAPPFDQALNAPLPVELAGSGHSWLTRYRTYPVFSPAWAMRRTGVWLSIAVLIFAVTLASFPLQPLADIPLGGLLQVAVQLFFPIAAGPWLCARVRRQGWPPKREAWALGGALLLLVAAVLGYHAWVAEPVKQKLAEVTGNVDDQGKRRRIVMALGLSVTRPDAPARTPATPAGAASATPMLGNPPQEPGPTANHVLNTFWSVLLTLWLGGGMGLWSWGRQHRGLQALAQARELARAQAQRREAELRLSVLAAQVEPHFLFNTLAGVRSAISTDPGRASDMIDHLVDYLRAAIPRLRNDGGADATLGSQLDIVRAYLGLMRSRMPRLSFDIDAPADLLPVPFPPLMLISLAENAVKHGVEPKVGAVQVQVLARRENDGGLSVTVSDNGAGFDANSSASGGGLGLSNIRERLLQMHGQRAALTLRARPEGGVSATLTVPLE